MAQKSRFTKISDDTVELVVSTEGCMRDPFHRKPPEQVTVRVRHAEGYGVLVSGTADPVVGRRALKAVGYKGTKSLPYRPYIGEGMERSPGGDIVFFFDARN